MAETTAKPKGKTRDYPHVLVKADGTREHKNVKKGDKK